LQASFRFAAFSQSRLSLQITVFAEPAAHANFPFPYSCSILVLTKSYLKALNRRIRKVPGGCAPEEGVTLYNADFDPKKREIGLKNICK
jgi:hypothetical protein